MTTTYNKVQEQYAKRKLIRKKVAKAIENIVCAISCGFLIWLALSWFDVICHNSYPGGAEFMSRFNFFVIFFS